MMPPTSSVLGRWDIEADPLGVCPSNKTSGSCSKEPVTLREGSLELRGASLFTGVQVFPYNFPWGGYFSNPIDNVIH